MRNKNLSKYIIAALVFTLLFALYIVLFDPFAVCYCMDDVQEKIELIKEHISKVQNEIRLCNHDLDSGVLSKEEYANISQNKAELVAQRKNLMEYLGKFRDLENSYINAKVIINSKK